MTYYAVKAGAVVRLLWVDKSVVPSHCLIEEESSNEFRTRPNTRFICVRYGNALVPRGSLTPLCHSQSKDAGKVTITVHQMTRFLLSDKQVEETILVAIEFAKPGDTLISIASSANILNINKALVENKDIEVNIIGIYPREKMHKFQISADRAYHMFKKDITT